MQSNVDRQMNNMNYRTDIHFWQQKRNKRENHETFINKVYVFSGMADRQTEKII